MSASKRLDTSLYKQRTVPRGYTYSYYSHPPSDANKPYLLFFHGFPSTSQDWAAQVHHLTSKGYGVIVPDLLGYGGTSKPGWREYPGAGIARDVFDIAQAEVDAGEGDENWKVVLVSHDWGSYIASRFIDLFYKHVQASVFLAVGYWPVPTSPEFDLTKAMDEYHAAYGTDRFGYWELFTAEGGPELMEKQVESTWDLLFPDDDKVWWTDMAPRGGARAWVESGRRGKVPKWWTEEARREHIDAILKHGGLNGPCAYYKCYMEGLQYDPTLLDLPMTGKHTSPVLYIAALTDYICTPALFIRDTKAILADPEKTLSVKEIEAGHWVAMAKPDELNSAVEEFLGEI